MSYEEFRKRIDTARQILVGAVPSPAGQIDQITYALMYKFMNDIDDKSAALPGGKRVYFVNEYDQYNWHRLMDASLGAHERLELYRNAIQTMAKNENIPELFRSIYQNAFLPFNSASVLTLFLKEIDKFSHGEGDDIGDAYEYLLSITGAQGDVGQFRTPRHIIKFIVEAVNPTKDDKVLDPAVGTAGFLIAAYNHVRSRHDGKDESGNPNDEKRLTADELHKIHHNYRGFDIDPTMVRTARVNMYLHGFKTPDIINHDSLSEETYWDDRYDIILANPPFMSPKGGIQPHKKFSIAANRAEVLFVDYIANHLKPSGRAGIVVPEGIIFQSGKAYKELRKNLVDNYLYAVVSLPAGVFQPYSGVKTSVLLLDKELAKQRDEILFVKIENDGYSLGAQRRPITGNQFPEALKQIQKFKNGGEINSHLAHAVKRKQIAESGDHNLSGDHYKTIDLHNNHQWEVVELGDVVDILDKLRKPITKGARQTGQYPYYGATGILDYVQDYIFDERLILLGEDGAKWQSGQKSAFIAEGKYWVNNHAHVLKPRQDRVIDTYLVNILNEMDLMPYITGVTVPKLNQEKMRGIKIPLPPIEIQREITAELDDYHKIIGAAQTIVKTYKPRVEISPEWKTVKLGDHLEVFSGFAFRSNLFNETGEGMPIIRIRDVKPGKTKTYYSGEYDPKFIVRDGDLLIGMDGEFNPVLWKGGKALLNQRVCRLEKFEGILPGYAFEVIKEKLRSIEATTYAVTVKHISAKQIKEIEIKLPPLELQHQIVARLEAEQQLVDANKKLIEIYKQKVKAKIAEVWGE